MRLGLIAATIGLAALAAATRSPAVLAAQPGRKTVSLDQDWRFHRGEVADGQAPGLDDSSWRQLDVPHDWSIEGPFDPQSPGGSRRRISQRRHRLVPQNVRHARRRPKDRRSAIEFDGAYMDSDVWLNGTAPGPASLRLHGLLLRADAASQARRAERAGRAAERHPALQPLVFRSGHFPPRAAAGRRPVHVAHWGTYVTTPTSHR